MANAYSTAHIDYLQRCSFLDPLRGFVEPFGPSDAVGIPSAEQLRLLRIHGLTRQALKQTVNQAYLSSKLMEDVVAGLYDLKIPIIYAILGTLDRVNIHIGTYRDTESHWPNDAKSKGSLHNDISVLKSALEGIFPGVMLEECSDLEVNQIYRFIISCQSFGLMTGIPTSKPGTETTELEQIERLIRGMFNTSWGYTVIAKPYPDRLSTDRSNQSLTELRKVQDAIMSSAENPIAKRYADLLELNVKRLTMARVQGLWRTAAYIFGADYGAFNRARALAKSTYTGEDSILDPVRVFECHMAKEEIANFGQITIPAPPPPPESEIRHIYKYLSDLTTSEAAVLLCLPKQEMPGYSVRSYARFDVTQALATSQDDRILVGEILDYGKKIGNSFTVERDSIKRHTLVAGVTGSGKTNTCFYILKQACELHVNFLVIEPVKTEYRALRETAELRDRLRVYTLGDERVSPFRMNPFEVPPNTLIQMHIDHLKAAFNASFAMYAPMPQVLEQCLQAVYVDKGWNLAENTNRRGVHSMAFPTLTDLYQKVDVVVDALGYETRITRDLKAALKTRINSLRLGGKGLMLDTRQSLPIEQILAYPTVLELEKIGDDDEKAFVMAILWIRLYEYLRSQYRSSNEDIPLKHITLIEEAHRLLTRTPRSHNPEIADVRGQAVEMFANILAEIRNVGEGIIIAEQIPVKLTPEALKNTNLKIVHRTVELEDRNVIGGALKLNDEQIEHLATLNVGEAVVYAEGEDGAFLVMVPPAKFSESMPLQPVSQTPVRVITEDTTSTARVRVVEQQRPRVSVQPDTSVEVKPAIDKTAVRVIASEAAVRPSTLPSQEGSHVSSPFDDIPTPSQPVVIKKTGSGQQSAVPIRIAPTDASAPIPINVISDTRQTLDSASMQLRLYMSTIYAQDMSTFLNHSFRLCRDCEWVTQLDCRLHAVQEPTMELAAAFSTYALSASVADGGAWAGEYRTLDSIMLADAKGLHRNWHVLCLTLQQYSYEYFDRLGNAYEWPYELQERIQDAYNAALLSVAKSYYDHGEATTEQYHSTRAVLRNYQALIRQSVQRSFDPYVACADICPDKTCYFRYHILWYGHMTSRQESFVAAFTQQNHEKTLVTLGLDVARSVICTNVPEEIHERIALCYLSQCIAHLGIGWTHRDDYMCALVSYVSDQLAPRKRRL